MSFPRDYTLGEYKGKEYLLSNPTYEAIDAIQGMESFAYSSYSPMTVNEINENIREFLE
jgi:hypothetical protein